MNLDPAWKATCNKDTTLPDMEPVLSTHQGVFVWLLGDSFRNARMGRAVPVTDLYGLPILGCDDIPRLVGLTAGHVFTKRSQTYWKKISISEGTWHVLGPNMLPTGKRRPMGHQKPAWHRCHLNQVIEFSITNDPTDNYMYQQHKWPSLCGILTKEA